MLAISIESFGKVETADSVHEQARHAIQSSASINGIEMATFFVGKQLFALHAESVLEALPATSVNPVSASRLPYCIGTLARHAQGQVTGFVWVFDLGELLSGQRSRLTKNTRWWWLSTASASLVCWSAPCMACTTSPVSVRPAPSMAGGAELLVHELIQANQGALLIQCLNPQGLLHALQSPRKSGEAMEYIG